jgi:hypothetical protein
MPTAKPPRPPLERAAFVLVAMLGVSFAGSPAAAQGVTVFRSTQAANLPTAQTIRAGNFMFEISHRFVPPVSAGAAQLWGLDGPVFNRLGLAYAPTDRVMLGVLRSNLDGNLELNAKGRLLEGQFGGLRYQLGAMGGVAWNFNAQPLGGVEDNEVQYYAQGIVNAAVGDRFALGVVPTAFRNPRIADVDPVNTVALGLHGQYWLSGGMSLIAEWNLSVESVAYAHDAVSLGIDMQTRGHVFKVLVSNQVRMNPTQFLVGTPYGYGGDDWRLGFNITRVLSF